MKICRSRKTLITKLMAAALCASLLLPAGMPVMAAQADTTAQAQTTEQPTEAKTEAKTEAATTEEKATESSDDSSEVNGKLGKNTDVGIEMAKSVTSQPGKKTKLSFTLKSLDKKKVKIKSVYPVIDASFPFETSGDAYKVVKAGAKEAKKQLSLPAVYNMTARSDVMSGYQSVKFICEYTKTDEDGNAASYYILKTINVYFEEDVTEEPDDEKDDGYPEPDREEDTEEAVAPKLILTGMETDPARIMAGTSFKLKVHIQNTSKTTPVCNGKFLIGNEAGTFLPTNGSSAVYVEKIPAGETADLDIELKTSADLPQKNYIIVVKGDFDDGRGNNFTSSDNLSISVYQEVKLGVSDISLSPESLGIGSNGSLMFTVNNQGSAGAFNVRASVKDEAVTGDECFVGNIAANASAFATINLKGVKDNSETGMITVVISYEDSEGKAGKLEQKMACPVGKDFVPEEEDLDWEEDDDFYEDEEDGLPWWVYALIALAVVIVLVIIIVLVKKRKKKHLQELLAEDDELDGDSLMDEEDEEEVTMEDSGEPEADEPANKDGEEQNEDS